MKLYGGRFGEGDVIGVTLDFDKGTLSFSRNGLDLGVAFEGVLANGSSSGVGGGGGGMGGQGGLSHNGEIYPAVAFYNQGQQVSLLPHTFSCPGAGPSAVAGSSQNGSSGVREASELSELLGCCKARIPLSAKLLR